MIVGHIGGAGSPYEIQKSLRFRASASAYLSRTPSVAGNRRTWTWSGWVKRGSLSTAHMLCSAGIITNVAQPTNADTFGFGTSGQLVFDLQYNGVSTQGSITTTATFRDPSSYYHVVLSVNTTNATQEDRAIIYVNGVRQLVTTSTAFVLNAQGETNGTRSHNIGRRIPDAFGGAYWNYLDGYLSEINFIDGQALDPSYFGQVSAETGAWIPKKYTGTYGTNGFYLPFNDGSTLANLTADRSGNGNNWTANNISLTAGVNYDWMDDVPRNSYAVLNPLLTNIASTEANLRVDNSDTSGYESRTVGSVGFGTSDIYFEVLVTGTYRNAQIGVQSAAWVNKDTNDPATRAFLTNTGQKASGTTYSAYGSAVTSGQVVGCAVSPTTGKIWFHINGVWQASGNPETGANPAFSDLSGTYVPLVKTYFATGTGSTTVQINFGQRPFAYSPPTGFKALCTKNLPTPSILNPKRHFDVVLATGTNIKSTAEAVFPGNFLEWIKDRGNANNHQLIDTARGTSAVLQSNTNGAETTYSAPSGSSVGWTWKAGGAPVTNNAGSIQSQVSANTAAGFSIVTYTGTGANATVGHGLGVAPKMVIVKRRNGTASQWAVYHASIGAANALYLNLTNAQAAAIAMWNSAAPTSSAVSIGTDATVNGNADTYVAYCFAEIPGYSKIGSYTGNGSADGPFVYCGFRPRFIMYKRTDTGSSNNWVTLDSARDTFNAVNLFVHPNLAGAEGGTIGGSGIVNFTANGFKVLSTFAGDNASGGSYIFYAIAEQPFQFANAR